MKLRGKRRTCRGILGFGVGALFGEPALLFLWRSAVGLRGDCDRVSAREGRAVHCRLCREAGIALKSGGDNRSRVGCGAVVPAVILVGGVSGRRVRDRAANY